MSRRITLTLGFGLAAAGFPALALGLGWLADPAGTFPAPAWMLSCAGACLLCTGAALLLPDSVPRPRGLLCALALSALAAIFDGAAFGNLRGGWRLMLETLADALALRQNAARNVLVLFATLLTLLALYAWSQWLRDAAQKPGTPPVGLGRRGKAKQDAE